MLDEWFNFRCHFINGRSLFAWTDDTNGAAYIHNRRDQRRFLYRNCVERNANDRKRTNFPFVQQSFYSNESNDNNDNNSGSKWRNLCMKSCAVVSVTIASYLTYKLYGEQRKKYYFTVIRNVNVVICVEWMSRQSTYDWVLRPLSITLFMIWVHIKFYSTAQQRVSTDNIQK